MPEVHLHGVPLREARRAMIATLEATTPPARTFRLGKRTEAHERARIRDKVRGTGTLAIAISKALDGMRAAFYRKAGLRAQESERGVDVLRRRLQEASGDYRDWTLQDYLDALEAIEPDELAAALKAAMAEQFELGMQHAELEVGTGFDVAPTEAKKALDDYALSFAADVADDQRAYLKDLLQAALDDGIGANELADQIAEYFGTVHRTLDDGSERAIDVDSWSQAVARTEIARAQNSGILTTYKAAGVATIMWLAADDERTCPTCADLDGQTTSMGTAFEKGIEQPPDPHTACRCTVVAVGYDDEGSGPDEDQTDLAAAA